jgi:chemotaxis-related protein WspD
MSEPALNPANIFDRPMPPGYRDELRDLLAAQPAAQAARGAGSVLLFQLGDLRLALPTRVAAAVAPVLHIARIPHRSGTVLLGLAAFRGEIMPCCSLSRILDLQRKDLQRKDLQRKDLQRKDLQRKDLPETAGSTARTLILEESPGRAWAIPIDGVLGVAATSSEVCPLDPPIAKHWLKGSFASPGGEFHLLDPDVLFRQMMLATA